jgi:aminoglycoside phosphotransferase (APT) family kinase protein
MSSEEEPLPLLQSIIAAHYPDWQARDFDLVGQGNESVVFRAVTDAFGAVAIKVPRARWVPSSTGAVDYRKYMRQEAALADHARQHGVPTPMTHALHFADDGFDFAVLEFVESDGSAPDNAEFGRLVRAIHTCPPPALRLGAEDGDSIHAIIANRLTQRARALEAVAGIDLQCIQRDAMLASLKPYKPRASLLHMDARPANLFTRQNRIVAISDWTNALIGDPALELARAAESGVVNAEFLAGYGDSHPFKHLPRDVELIYRLDTTVMLARLFLAEMHEMEAGHQMAWRSLELHHQLESAFDSR